MDVVEVVENEPPVAVVSVVDPLAEHLTHLWHHLLLLHFLMLVLLRIWLTLRLKFFLELPG